MNPVAKRTVTALALAAAVVLAIVHSPLWLVTAVFAAVVALAAVEFTTLLWRRSRSPAVRLGGTLLGVGVLVGGLSALPFAAWRYGNLMMLYLIAVVKLSDMGGFAFGISSAKLMKGGNHKLCPTVSPNKSWEGLGGSLLAATLMSLLLMPLTGFSWRWSVLFGVIAALVGTLGDLAESKFKRWAQVKDSSTMRVFNGLGGFLDMVDSLLLAPALLLALIVGFRLAGGC